MDIIKIISERYSGSISANAPYTGGTEFPFECPVLEAVLRQADGISETMVYPKTGEITVISEIYPYARMIKESQYFQKEYGIECIPFADNGADITFYFKSGGRIFSYAPIDNEEEFIFAVSSAEEFAEKWFTPAIG